MLLDQLAELHQPHATQVDKTIEDFVAEREPSEPPAPFTGPIRIALDSAFRHNKVELILKDLEVISLTSANSSVKQWASDTLAALKLRSPTSLKVALKAIRRGKDLELLKTLDMELKIATAFCCGASPDFITGVKAKFVDRIEDSERPNWSPASLDEVSEEEVVAKFFDTKSPYLTLAPELTIPADSTPGTRLDPEKYALPSESKIGSEVKAFDDGRGIQYEKLLQIFTKLQPGKLGVKEKIYEVVQRRCELADGGIGNKIRLKWKQPPKEDKDGV